MFVIEGFSLQQLCYRKCFPNIFIVERTLFAKFCQKFEIKDIFCYHSCQIDEGSIKSSNIRHKNHQNRQGHL